MKLSSLFAAITIGGLAISPAAIAQSDANVPPAQKAQIETVVHEYLTKNPEVVAEAIQSLQRKQMDQMKAQGIGAAVKNATALFNETSDPVDGNPGGKITLVEFFDYQCPHCVDMRPDIQALIKSNADLRVVYKEFPIRGPVSTTAAKAALAAGKQGKYIEMHDAIMNNAKDLNDQKIMDLAKGIGLDMTKFKADMNSKEIDDQIKSTYKLAQSLGLYGTPALFIAKTDFSKNPNPNAVVFIPGQVDQKYLQGEIDKIK